MLTNSRHSRTISRRMFVIAGSAAAAAAASTGSTFAADTAKITAIDHTYGNPPPSDGPGLKMINERFDVNYQPTFVPEASYTEKLTAVVASGDIPDIMYSPGDSNFYKWAGQGAFLALDDFIEQYPSFKLVPSLTLNAGRVNGKVYAIPQYYPPYSLTPSIRQDWLDKLGLKMPTSYDELKQVALAFTKQDPSGRGAGKTYGIAMGQTINPSYAMGAWWDPDSWLHKDDQGRLLLGSITDASKERIQFLAELYAEGAVSRDFAVMDWAATNKEFYSGKAGIFIGAPRGMSQDYMAGLLQIDPGARPVPIPPFKAPDGAQEFLATAGFSGLTTFSAKLAKDKDKTKAILDMLDFRRTFYPADQQTPQNKDYDWLMGGEGKGYDVVDGKIVPKDGTTNPQGLAPNEYLVGGTAWVPKPSDLDYSKGYTKEPIMGAWAKALQDMWTQTKGYTNPTIGVQSKTFEDKGTDLTQFLSDEQTKMVAGQRKLDTWDDMVSEWQSRGGEAYIQEINDGLKNMQG